MIRRSECTCLCHQGLLIHIAACCRPDDEVSYTEKSTSQNHAEIQIIDVKGLACIDLRDEKFEKDD